MAVSGDDLEHLRRCADLARIALQGGDEPFGSLLVDSAGTVAPGVVVDGPAAELTETMKSMYKKAFGR